MTILETVLMILLAFAVAFAVVYWHFSRMYHHAAGGSLKPIGRRGDVSWLVVADCADGRMAHFKLIAEATEDQVRDVAAKVYFECRELSPTVRAFRAFELPVSIEIEGERGDVAIGDEVKL